MDQAALIELIQKVIWLILLLGAPILVTSMVVGVIISIFQAVTQIQESTLTFVPKILASLVVFVITLPWMINTLVDEAGSMLDLLAEITP